MNKIARVRPVPEITKASERSYHASSKDHQWHCHIDQDGPHWRYTTNGAEDWEQKRFTKKKYLRLLNRLLRQYRNKENSARDLLVQAEKALNAGRFDRFHELVRSSADSLIPAQETSTPAPTQDEWPESLHQNAYHGLAGDLVRAIGPISEADEAGLLAQFLIAFGSAAGRNARFRVGHAEHRVNLFCVLVGRTAKSRKGTSWAEVEHPFESADRVWAERCLLPGGLASGEGLIWAVRDPTEKKMKPPRGSKQDQDITKTLDDGIEDKRLLVLETEFASPLRIIRREGNILSAVIRRAWDKGNLSNLSKHSPARATGAHISIIGHITREELLREFSASEGSNGFANRFLWVCVRRSKLLPLGGRLPEETSRSLIGRLQQALVFSRKAGEMRFTKQAKELWCKSYAKLSDEIPGLLGAITSRGEAQVLRLSMVYALLDSTILINRKHLRAALAIWRYCEDSARYIFGDALGDYVADTILRKLRATPKGLVRTDIREIFSRNRGENEINNALRVLLEHGLARPVREETGGRPSERWLAVR